MAFLIQSLFTLIEHARGPVLELLPLEVLKTSQPCTVTGTACSQAELMLHYFNLSFGILQKEQFYYSWYPPNSGRFKQVYSLVLPLLFVCCFADDPFNLQ